MSKLKTEERKPTIRNKGASYVLYVRQDDGSILEQASFSTPEQLCNLYQKRIEEHPGKEYREKLVMKKEVTLKPTITERKMTVRL